MSATLEAIETNGNSVTKLLNGDIIKKSNNSISNTAVATTTINGAEPMDSDDIDQTVDSERVQLKQESCRMIVESDQEEADYDDDDTETTTTNPNNITNSTVETQIKIELKPVLTNGHHNGNETNGNGNDHDMEEESGTHEEVNNTNIVPDSKPILLKTEPDENIEEKRKRRIALKREKHFKLKQLQLDLKKEEAKLMLLKRLYYSQHIVPQPGNSVNNNNSNSNANQQRNLHNSLQQKQNQLNNSNSKNPSQLIKNNQAPSFNNLNNQLQQQQAQNQKQQLLNKKVSCYLFHHVSSFESKKSATSKKKYTNHSSCSFRVLLSEWNLFYLAFTKYFIDDNF